MRDLNSFVASLPGGLGLGVLYWDSDAGPSLGEFTSGRAAEPVIDDDQIGGTAIMSAPSTTFTVNQPGTFTVLSNGQPIPSVTESGALPAGVTFVDNGDDTGTFAGTPANGSDGNYAVTITASNGLVATTQSFTLSVVGLNTSAALTPPPVNGYYNQNPTVTLTAPDAGGPGVAHTYYQVDNAGYQLYTGRSRSAETAPTS